MGLVMVAADADGRKDSTDTEDSDGKSDEDSTSAGDDAETSSSASSGVLALEDSPREGDDAETEPDETTALVAVSVEGDDADGGDSSAEDPAAADTLALPERKGSKKNRGTEDANSTQHPLARAKSAGAAAVEWLTSPDKAEEEREQSERNARDTVWDEDVLNETRRVRQKMDDYAGATSVLAKHDSDLKDFFVGQKRCEAAELPNAVLANTGIGAGSGAAAVTNNGNGAGPQAKTPEELEEDKSWLGRQVICLHEVHKIYARDAALDYAILDHGEWEDEKNRKKSGSSGSSSSKDSQNEESGADVALADFVLGANGAAAEDEKKSSSEDEPQTGKDESTAASTGGQSATEESDDGENSTAVGDSSPASSADDKNDREKPSPTKAADPNNLYNIDQTLYNHAVQGVSWARESGEKYDPISGAPRKSSLWTRSPPTARRSCSLTFLDFSAQMGAARRPSSR